MHDLYEALSKKSWPGPCCPHRPTVHSLLYLRDPKCGNTYTGHFPSHCFWPASRCLLLHLLSTPWSKQKYACENCRGKKCFRDVSRHFALSSFKNYLVSTILEGRWAVLDLTGFCSAPLLPLLGAHSWQSSRTPGLTSGLLDASKHLFCCTISPSPRKQPTNIF